MAIGNAVNSPESAPFLAKAGGTMTGNLTLNGAPSTTNMAANKGYVDGFISNVVIQVITATGTYTPTSGMKYCIVELVGSGGGGGGAAAVGGQSGQGGGGGGGGYCRKRYTAAQIGATASVQIGAVGAGGAAGNNNGTAGIDATFNPSGGGAALTAFGGGLGIGSASTATSSSVAGGAGGAAANGDLNLPGQSGSPGVVVLGSGPVNSGGAGGSSILGTSGNIYGAGGAGAVATGGIDVAGTAGKLGVCYITEFI